MKVLGIDPGSETTGWGVVEGNGLRYKLVEYGAIKAPASLEFAHRLLIVGDGLTQLIERHKPEACAVEEAFYANNPKVAIKLGQVRGVALYVAARAKLEVAEYSPRLVKQTVVGYGNAEKQQVQQMVKLLLNLPAPPQPHDAADALAIAITHFHHAGVKQRLLAAEARIKLAAGPRRTR
jgi:crossover junction endodeoxyribonuclease RuvC